MFWEGEEQDRLKAELRTDAHSAGFNNAEGKAIAADFKLQRITQRCGSERPDRLTVGQTHFQESHGHGVVPLDVEDRRGLAFGQLIESLRQRLLRKRFVGSPPFVLISVRCEPVGASRGFFSSTRG